MAAPDSRAPALHPAALAPTAACRRAGRPFPRPTEATNGGPSPTPPGIPVARRSSPADRADAAGWPRGSTGPTLRGAPSLLTPASDEDASAVDQHESGHACAGFGQPA